MRTDSKIVYDRTSIERDETGVYLFYWYDSTRVAIKRLEDFLNFPEVKNKYYENKAKDK